MTERSSRIESIDALRGLVMVIMVLDHARHAFMGPGDPENLQTTTTALFLSRWVTHFCAPVFVFLAGTSAWLYHSRGRSKGEVSRFLLTRGLWLIVLEVTVVTFGWVHSLQLIFWQVIAAIGVAMIVLGVALHLPRMVILTLGAALVFGQDAYALLVDCFLPDGIDAWRFLHGGMLRPTFGFVTTPIGQALVVYPVLVWCGVMILGYLAGGLFGGEPRDRRKRFITLGLVVSLAFVVVRALDGYGNVLPWRNVANGEAWMAFLKCEKYPPSVAYLLMTLGPALILLGYFERIPGAVTRVLQVFGRVPMFFYILHIYMLHCGSRLVFWLLEGEPVLVLRVEMGMDPVPEGFEGLGLAIVYVITATCVAALYPLCRWYGGVKRRSKSAILSYL